MKNLLICCLFGNTANSLAKKMQQVANVRGYQITVSAVGVNNFDSVAPVYDCFLIAPHIQYKLDELAAVIKAGQPISVIDGYHYVVLDAEKILDFAINRMAELTE